MKVTIEDDLISVLEDIGQSSEQISSDPKSFFEQFPLFPPTIPGEKGRQYFMTQAGAASITRIADAIRRDSLELRRALSRQDMRDLTSRSIGELISELSTGSDARALKRRLRHKIDAHLSELKIERTHLFGAWVLEASGIKSLEVGPAKFFHRDLWLSSAVESGLLTSDCASRISAQWATGQPRDPKVQRGNLADPITGDYWESDVLDAVGPCTWICAVDVSGHSLKRSQEKAIIAARIGSATIGLSWQRPSASSRDLDGLRARAEMLATATLRACIQWLGLYDGPDDEDAFRRP